MWWRLVLPVLAALCGLVAGGEAGAQPGAAFDPLGAVNAALGSPIAVEAAIEPGSGTTPPSLVVTARLEEGWHLYSIAQKPGGPKPTRIVVAPESPWVPVGPFVPDEAPHARTVTDVPGWAGLTVEEHSGTVVWRAPLLRNPASNAEAVTGTVSVQLCRDTSCSPPESIPFRVVAPAPPAASPGPIGDMPPDADGLPGVTSGTIATHVPPRSHVGVEAAFAAERDRSGDVPGRVWPLVVRLTPDEGFHLYAPAASADSEVGQGKPTVVAVPARDAVVRVLGATPARSEEIAAAKGVDGPVTLEIALPAGEGPDDGTVEILIGFQTCTETSCDPPAALRLKATLPPAGSGVEAGAIEFSAAKYAESAKKPLPPLSLATVEAPVGSTGAGGDPVGPAAAPPRSTQPSTPLPRGPVATPARQGVVEAAAPPAARPAALLSLPAALLSGLLGGLILNLMPCVLPVLGLKLMSFAQQSGKKRQEIFRMNLWYCAGVYAVFFALATASVAANLGLGSRNLAWGEQFTSAGFNITMAAIVFAFALSFLGVWEIPIPGFIGEKAGQVHRQEGAAGSFLKGVLSTVLATPCSGPFLGPVFGFTLTQPTSVTYAVFGAIATGMALPYILVGLLPGLARFLPKPGAWMETFKEVLGFVMLGTVVFLFTFLKSDWFVPTFALLVGIWAACWWIGKAQERSGGDVGFGRWVQAVSVAAAIGFAAFTFLGPVKSVIAWEPFSRARLAELRSGGATVLVDFSADWCMTCKLNLATAIETEKVRAAIAENGVVPLLADWTEESPEIKATLESLQSKSIPVLAIFPAPRPGGAAPEPIILRDLITERQVLAAIEQAGPSVSPAAIPRAASATLSHGR